MIGPTTTFWLGALGMLVGTIAFAWGGISAREEYRQYYGLLVAISLIAAIAYATMALEIGWVPVGEETVFVPRYIDWILTTPLLLWFLALLAGSDTHELGQVVGINTVVMVFGFGAALVGGALGYVLFAIAAIAYVGLVYLLLGPMTARASKQGTGISSLFTSLRNLTVVLWSVYPIIWLFGPPGVGLISVGVDIMLITYLDLLTKVGFGFIALNASSVIEAELGRSLAKEVDGVTAD